MRSPEPVRQTWPAECLWEFPMRTAALFIALVLPLPAQFKSTVPLVLAPTSITDSKGHAIEGLNPEDLILYDNNVPQTIHIDWAAHPISLVVAVQNSSNAGGVIDKLGGAGILLTQLLAAEAGEIAILSFGGQVKIRQEFTADPDLVTHSLRMLRKEGDSAPMLDALRQAAIMLAERPPDRRRIVLMIGEKRDRASEAKLTEVVERVQRLNATVYWLTFSPFVQPFTVKPKTAEDLKPEAERIKYKKCPLCPDPDNTAVPYDPGPGGYLYALGELARLHQPDLSTLFTTSTGGRAINFVKKNALEQAIEAVGEEVHSQYLLSFQPAAAEPGSFHAIRIAVRNRPELRVKTRQGYWALD
jgi:VWFA-related protein